MTSSPAAAAPVWFLYKLFSDLGIYYYFAGEKRARERSEILVCIPGDEGSVGREGRMKGPTTRGSSLIVYVMWKNDLSPSAVRRSAVVVLVFALTKSISL